MKKICKVIMIAAVLLSCMMITDSAYASGNYAAIYTNYSWPVEKRTAGGTVFESTYIANGNSRLKAEKGGKTVIISQEANGGKIVTDGNIVYYCTSRASGLTLYKKNLKTGTNKKIKVIGDSNTYGIELSGIFKNEIYFVRNVPEGSFGKVNIKSKKVRNISVGKRTVTTAEQYNQYFVLLDGTGAGYSYLGLWNANKSTFTRLTKYPVRYVKTKKYIYYVRKAGVTQDTWDKGTVNRYTLSTGKTQKLLSIDGMAQVQDFTSKYIRYYDRDHVLRTKKW